MENMPNIKRRFLKLALVAISALSIVAVILAIILMPYLVDCYQDTVNQVLGYHVIIFMWITSVPLLVMLFNFLTLSISLVKERIFMEKAIKKMSVFQICTLIEIALYAYATFRFQTIIAVIILYGAILIEILATLVRELLRDGKEYFIDSTLSV
ncbi:MAG: hypothetical protein Q8865_10320 [Bacillota bacterium]|nr:hypothetical protein [Bacillota bacterium]